MATNYTSKAPGGNWNGAATWNEGVGPPASGDTVSISHPVVMNVSSSIGNTAAAATPAVTITTGGSLTWPTNASVTLTCVGTNTTVAAINILNGGILQLGAAGAEIGSSYIAKILMTSAQRKILVTTAGEVRLYGCPNYRTERATMVSNVAFGPGVTIQTADAQNWQNGDEIWIGTGADKNTAPTDYEKVTITSHPDTTHFVCTTTKNHVAGDVLVNGMRNVIIDGNARAGGVSVVATNTTVTAVNCGTFNMKVRASWAEFQFFGFTSNTNAIFVTISGTASFINWTIPADYFKIEHCLFDTTYAATTTGIRYVSTFPTADSSTAFTDNHFYGTGGANTTGMILATHGDVWTLNNWTFVGARTYGIYPSASHSRLIVTNLWATGDSTNVMQTFYYTGGSFQISNSNFYACKGVRSEHYEVEETTMYEQNTISNCKFYHSPASGYHLHLVGDAGAGIRNTYVSDCTFYDSVNESVFLDVYYYGGTTIFERCTFDNTNTGNTVSMGAVGISSGSGCPWGTLEFISCDFGMTTVNKRRNVSFYMGTTLIYLNAFRMLFENCRFKEPTTFVWTGAGSGDWADALGWMVQDQAAVLNQWDARVKFADNISCEFVNCQAIKAADLSDQFQVLYPGVTRWGVAGGGGSEMMDEPVVILDGTLAMKFVPFHCVVRSNFNKSIPITFPITSGQTVTVNVSMRKQAATQATGRRPMVHLFGCGINTSQEMTDRLDNTWEVRTVTGVATHTGDMKVWFSGISEWEVASGSVTDPYNIVYSPATIGTYFFYADALSIVIV